MDDSTLNERFGQLEGLIKSGVNHLNGRFDRMATQFDGLSVRVDGLQTQIKLVAEGHGTLVDHIVEMKGGLARLEEGQTSLVLRVSVVESRVNEVEKTQKLMLAEVRGLAAHGR